MRVERMDLLKALADASGSELALAGEIAVLLGGRDVFESMDTAVDRLREQTGADVCELFVTDPWGREMILVSHAGPDLVAFSQQDRFAAGEDLPGLVLQGGVALWTDALDRETDFTRSRVTALGYGSAACVPIWDGGKVGGCVFLAWKSPADLERAVRSVVVVCRPMGMALEAWRAQTRLEGAQQPAAAEEWPQEVEERLRALTGADVSTVKFFSDATNPELRAAVGEDGDRRRRLAAVDCPVRHTGEVHVLGGREGWPKECLEAGCNGKVRYCVPLATAGTLWGVATVAYRRSQPAPRTTRLPAALWFGQEVALPAPGNGEAVPSARPAENVRLRIRCFGGFEVFVNGHRLGHSELNREKAWELLALLVAASGRPASGERLAAQLWPDTDASLARNRFHVTLSSLRSVIEPGGEDGWVYLRRDGRRYYLDPDAPVWVDLWRFHELVRQARSAEAELRHRDKVLTLVESAAALYRGDLFDGAYLSEWCAGVAARCREDALDVMDRLARLRWESGDAAGALEALRRAEAIDPLREDLQRRLMEVLAGMGRRQEALASYVRLKDRLEEDHGLEPSPETRRVFEAIQAPA